MEAEAPPLRLAFGHDGYTLSLDAFDARRDELEDEGEATRGSGFR